MRLWPTAILSALAVVLAGYSGYVTVENSSLKRQVDNLRAMQNDPVAAPRITLSPEVDDGVIEGMANVEQAESGPRSRMEEFANMSPEERRARFEEMRAQRAAQALEAFEDPELRMDMVERNMERIDRAYADLFKRLGLPADQIDALKTLMAEQGVLRMETQLRMSMASEEEREALRELMKGKGDQLNQDIYALLGEENVGKYKYYNNTLKYRGDVDSFERTLSYTDSPISERQSEGLVRAYAAVDNQFEFSVDINEARRGGAQLTQDMVDTYYREREEYDALLLEKASRVLSEQQLASLAAQQISNREREQRQMEYQLENGSGGGFRGGFDGGGFRGGPSGGFRGDRGGFRGGSGDGRGGR